MRFFEVLKRRKILFLNIFLFLYIAINLFTGDRGLGSVIIVAHNNIDMPTLFSSVFSLAFIGVSLTIMLVFCERKILFWHDSNLRV